MTEFCPHCGYNFAKDEPIMRGKWTLSPESTWLNGERLKVTPYEAGMLYTLAKAAGKPVRPEVIANRLGSDAQDAGNVCSVRAYNLRAKLPEVPFDTVQGLGYRWAA